MQEASEKDPIMHDDGLEKIVNVRLDLAGSKMSGQ